MGVEKSDGEPQVGILVDVSNVGVLGGTKSIFDPLPFVNPLKKKMFFALAFLIFQQKTPDDASRTLKKEKAHRVCGIRLGKDLLGKKGTNKQVLRLSV